MSKTRTAKPRYDKRNAGQGITSATQGNEFSLLSKVDKSMSKESDRDSGEKIIPTFCHGCGAAKPRCAVLCHVKDGKFVRVEGNPEAFNNWGAGCTSLCAKGNTGMQFLYSPNRLKYPMKRIGEKGEGKFQRITWDEALDTIAEKLKETKEKYGPESYAVLSPEFWPVLATLGRRFLNVHGSPNYLHSAICATPRAAAATDYRRF